MITYIQIKKILVILFFSKNLDPIFFGYTISTLKSIFQDNTNKINQEKNDVCKLRLNSSVSILLLIYLNILSTYILNKDYESNLSKLNEEVSIYRINRRKFSPSKSELLKNEFNFRLQKEFYYTQQQKRRFLNTETIACLERLNNIKYL